MRHSAWFRSVAGLLIVIALTAVPACGGNDDGESDSSGGGDVAAMLAQLPAVDRSSGATIYVAYGDLARATEAAGTERPRDPGDVEDIAAWSLDISGVDSQVAVAFPSTAQPRSPNDFAATDDELGFSLLDVDQYIELQMPPESLAVLAGEMGDDDLERALGSANDGVFSAGDGDDFEIDPEQPTPARPIGAPLRLGTRDGLIAVSPSTPRLEKWLSADAPTLADDDAFAAIAQQLAGADVYGASITGFPGSAPTSNPFDTVGIGLAVDDDGSLGLIVYHYADDAAAAAAVDAVEDLLDGASSRTNEAWSEVFSSADVVADRSVVVVRVRFVDNDRTEILYSALLTGDTLFALE